MKFKPFQQLISKIIGHQALAPNDEYILVRKSDWEAQQRRIQELEEKLAWAINHIQEQDEELRIGRARIAELEEQLRISSQNSSKPPSSDPPSVEKQSKPKSENTGKKPRGAQPKHAKMERELLPPEQVTTVVTCVPASSCECGHPVVVQIQPQRRQVFEIPKIQPEVTEYQLFSGMCSGCGKIHHGHVPEGTPRGILGPRAMAYIAVLSGKYHQSKRNIQEILEDFFGLTLCLGSISKAEGRVSEALAAPVAEAKAYVQNQNIVHMDETGHKIAGKKGWMWVAATQLVAVFMISTSRGAQVAKDILGETFKGYLISDRWSAYNWIAPAFRQLCWSHLIRDFTKISERPGHPGKIGRSLLGWTYEMFHHWHRVRDGTLPRNQFQELMAIIRARIEGLLEEGASCDHGKTKRTCARILKLKEALWTFVMVAEVEPTNNFAERIIRPFVLWRKMSFGTQSDRGNLFAERMMTVCQTCRLQKRNVLDFVTQAMKAYLTGKSMPSLLPSPTTESERLAS